ncbi:MAG: FapA family protein [Desulfurivibrionaceae bacterium]|nr:FapA family protein [Desulfurivibrionaceae bacterium]
MAEITLGAYPQKICDNKYFLQLSKDKLHLLLALQEATDLEPADWPEVKAIALAAGVCHGFHEGVPLLKEGKAVIATGTPARHGENAKVRPLVRPAVVQDKDEEQARNVRREFRELGNIVNVPEGQLLLEKIPATPGVPGRNVLGAEIAARDGKDVHMKCGPGVSLSEDGLRVTSTVKGKFVMEGGKPAVYEEHVVHSDVDLSVGNITFSGRQLVIKGHVLPGFRVKCMGSIDISEGVNNAEIIAGTDLKIRGGLIGDECSIRVWGDMDVDFCENTGPVESRGTISIADFVVQGNMKVEKDLKALSGKGALIGGRYVLGGSLYALELGSDAEVLTEIVVGLNPGLEQKKKKIEEAKGIWPPRLTEMLKDISALSAMKKKEGKGFSPQNELKLKKLNGLMPKVMEANNHLAELEEKLDAEIEKAATQSVYVYGRVHAGVQITIGKICRVLTSPEEGVIIAFVREKQAIHVRTMTPSERESVALGA